MELTAVLREYGRRYGIGELLAEPDGSYVLALDGGVRLVVEPRPAGGVVLLRIPLEPADRSDAARLVLYRRVLEANLLGEEVRGAVFSLDEEDDRLGLHRRVPLHDGLDTGEFAEQVELLYGTARHFAAELGLRFVTDRAG